MADKEKSRSVRPPATGQATPPISVDAKGEPAPSSSAEVSAFVARMKALEPVANGACGRLIFAMDATMSRQPTWDLAVGLQAEMFHVVEAVGGLDVQLIYFRGSGECRASRWVRDPAELARLIGTVSCHGGLTQIGKVLIHARAETAKAKVHALVYVGDCMEEPVDSVCARAGELALLGVPVFLFQEGDNREAATAFAEIARLTRGAHCRFDAGAADQLRDLLTAVAVYASGGRMALKRLSGQARNGSGARKLLGQMR